MDEKLKEFISILVGNFDNSRQVEMKSGFVKAYHRNTIINEKIENLPKDYKNVFMLEESYYLLNNQLRKLPHLFEFSLVNDEIKLDSYKLPDGYNNDNFNLENLKMLDYNNLQKSETFVPILYHQLADGSYEGSSISQLNPQTTLKIAEKFNQDYLEVEESMYRGDQKVFGFDEPIIYKRMMK